MPTSIDDIDPVLLEALAGALRCADVMTPDLNAAVRIEAWELVWAVGGLGLLGVVYGHPDIADGRRALTSTLFAIDLEAGWAISRNRTYLLGRTADDRVH